MGAKPHRPHILSHGPVQVSRGPVTQVGLHPRPPSTSLQDCVSRNVLSRPVAGKLDELTLRKERCCRLPPPALPPCRPARRAAASHLIDCSANVRSEVWPLPARQFTGIREGEPERGARLQEDMQLLPCRNVLWAVGGPCTARSTALWPRLCTELVSHRAGLVER